MPRKHSWHQTPGGVDLAAPHSPGLASAALLNVYTYAALAT
jgi:hypothetical protein